MHTAKSSAARWANATQVGRETLVFSRARNGPTRHGTLRGAGCDPGSAPRESHEVPCAHKSIIHRNSLHPRYHVNCDAIVSAPRPDQRSPPSGRKACRTRDGILRGAGGYPGSAPRDSHEVPCAHMSMTRQNENLFRHHNNAPPSGREACRTRDGILRGAGGCPGSAPRDSHEVPCAHMSMIHQNSWRP